MQSTGDHESKETKAENYIEFVIVDEENRPLGGVKSAGEGEGHDIPANIVHEDAPAEAPRSPTPPPTTNDDGVNGGVYLYTSESRPATPASVMESNSGQVRNLLIQHPLYDPNFWSRFSKVLNRPMGKSGCKWPTR